MSKLYVSTKVPASYIRSVFFDIVRLIEEQVNNLLVLKTGTFTLAAAATKTVNDTNVTALSQIALMPTNASAGTVMGSSQSLYVSARTAGVSFVVSTADGTNAAGTETFQYKIFG